MSEEAVKARALGLCDGADNTYDRLGTWGGNIKKENDSEISSIKVYLQDGFRARNREELAASIRAIACIRHRGESCQTSTSGDLSIVDRTNIKGK